MTMLESALEILQGGGAMHYTEIWKAMAKRGVGTNGKTPWHSVRVMMTRAPDKIEHLEGGFFRLVQEPPKAPPQKPSDDMVFEIINDHWPRANRKE
jgi:HB1, ASXL, restriction endonuclease HTH domain